MAKRYQAVIFDLAGTLVDFSVREHERVLERTAKEFGVTGDAYARCYAATYLRQEEGAFDTVETCLEEIGCLLACTLESDQINLAAQIRMDFMRRLLSTPREHALQVLTELQAAGERIGLITNCPPEVPLAWPGTRLAALVDVAVFSCRAGIRKPDVRISEPRPSGWTCHQSAASSSATAAVPS